MNNMTAPADIQVDLKRKQVTITWTDDHVSRFTLKQLRQNCPCALCQDIRDRLTADPLQVLPEDQANASDTLDPQNPVQMVGQYALQLFWDDGHRTGIYTYTYLRELG